jgi:hypothetical protein
MGAAFGYSYQIIYLSRLGKHARGGMAGARTAKTLTAFVFLRAAAINLAPPFQKERQAIGK